MTNEIFNLGILLQILGIFIAFPLKLIYMYCYVMKKSYEIAKEGNDVLIENQSDDISYNWLMYKIQLKIYVLVYMKWFQYLSKNFSKDFPEAFKPNPFLVSVAGFIIILGLIFQFN